MTLNKHRKGIAARKFYKLFIYVYDFMHLENVSTEMREEVKEEILQAMKILAQI